MPYKLGTFPIHAFYFAENCKGLYNPESLWREYGRAAPLSKSLEANTIPNKHFKSQSKILSGSILRHWYFFSTKTTHIMSETGMQLSLRLLALTPRLLRWKWPSLDLGKRVVDTLQVMCSLLCICLLLCTDITSPAWAWLVNFDL